MRERLSQWQASDWLDKPWVMWVALAFMSIPALMVVTTPLSLAWQAVFAIGATLAAMRMRHIEGHLISIALMVISLLASSRYIYWRLTESVSFDQHRSFTDMFFAVGLIGAELYAFMVLALGFFQVVWPLHRKPVPLPDDQSLWPSVDVFIPTYNEPLSVVRPTVLAAMEMDWPADKFRVYVLDDGRREEFKTFCAEVGATHITRNDSKHAKAGNINRALEKTSGEFITIFDCDHVPTRSFLQLTLGLFLHDSKMALVQTPHHFFSPDPFERNLRTFRKVPNEGELFYGLLQDGNDLWDATFFCGSCAVIRREALLEVGGIAVETVTEDAHTSLKMHSRGWRSAYINIAQAAGLATESLSAHVGQRIRWARGMAQIFRIDNPLFKRGLKWFQRLCYFNAMMHFFYGLPRIVFLTAPLSYLFFEAHIIDAPALTILAYAAPHLVLANLTNSRLQGPFRHSFWAEVYESVLATYILIPTTMAVINPKLGTFNVTAKGGIVENEYFDQQIAKPYVVLLLLNTVGMIVGVGRLFFWNTNETDTVLLNMAWTIYNLLIVGAALSVAWEQRQIRKAIRVEAELLAGLALPDGRVFTTKTFDLSETGTSLTLPEGVEVAHGTIVEVALAPDYREVWMPAEVVRAVGGRVGLRFGKLDVEQEKQLIYAIFGRADAWVSWSEDRGMDVPSASFKEILGIGVSGIGRLIAMGSKSVENAVKNALGIKRRSKLASWLLVVAALSALSVAPDSHAQSAAQVSAQQQAAASAGTGKPMKDQATTDRVIRSHSRQLTLEDLGISRPIRLRGLQGEVSVPVNVRDDEIVTRARLHLKFAHSPSLLWDVSHLNVLVNNELAGTLPISAETASGTERTIDIDPRLFVQYNQITLQLIAHYRYECEDPAYTSLWGVVSNQTVLELDTEPLSLSNDLNLLPSPFFDGRDTRRLTLPFVFSGTPTLDALDAAGVTASWFGAMANYRGAEFPTYIDSLPPGHGVVFVVGGRGPAGLRLPSNNASASISIVDNPKTPGAKLLVIQGADGLALKQAARSLAMGSEALAGPSTAIREFSEPEPREPYDAPRWIPTDRPVEIGEIAESWQLEASGLYPDTIRINFHLPPDLFTWQSDGMEVNLKYRYTPTVGSKSTLNVNINDGFVEAIALSYLDEEGASADRINLPFVSSFEAVNEAKVSIPDYKIGGDNQLQLQYYFERKKEGQCKDIVLDNLRGVIDEDSTVDLSDIPHYAFLPDLALFADGGFPFSRLADLSETGIVLPSNITPQEISAYLLVMGRLGDVTGYPAIRFQLVHADRISELSDRDILVFGAAGNQPLLEQWADYMPMTVARGETRLRVIGPVERLRARWEGRDVEGAINHAGRVILEAGRSLGGVMSFESPLSSGRTVVVLTAGDSDRLLDVARMFTDYGKVPFVQGDLVLLNGDEVNHYSLENQYAVGRLPFLLGLRWWLSQQPLILVIFVVVIALLLAAILFRLLRRMAAARKDGHA